MCLELVTYASSFRALACGVDGVYHGVDQGWVADDGLVVHQPDVDDAAVGVGGVVVVVGVMLDQVGTSLVGCLLDPLCSCVCDALPSGLPGCLVCWGVGCLGSWECVPSLGLVDKCPGVSGLFN